MHKKIPRWIIRYLRVLSIVKWDNAHTIRFQIVPPARVNIKSWLKSVCKPGE